MISSNNENDVIIDAEYKEFSGDNAELNKEEIRKEPLYYTGKQVGQILGEKESTVRYWATQFSSILNIKVSNMVRRYTKTDIENLLFIKKLLKEDNMTIKQALEYCTKEGFSNEEGLLDTSNPLAIKTFTRAMSTEIDAKMNKMKDEIIEQQKIMIEQLTNLIQSKNEDLAGKISLAVDEVITEKMEEVIADNKKMKDSLDMINKNIESYTKDAEMVNSLQQKLIEKQEKYMEEKKEGFFSKFFKK